MVENPSIAMDRAAEASNTVATKKRSRYPVNDEGGETIECSGEDCSSCAASFVADCIAICCCPCAIVNLLSLAFVKVPWMMGRRCWVLVEKKVRMLERKERKKSKEEKKNVRERDGNLRKERVVEGKVEIPNGVVVGETESYCARFEAERVWLELYQVGHLGFGRVSFTGIPVKEKL